MSKQIKFVAGLGVGVLILFSLFILLRSGNNPIDQTPSSQQPKPGVLEVRAKNSEDKIEVRDFNQNPIAKYKETTVIVDNEDFSIVYFPDDQAFLITLLSQPVAQGREKAEQEFVKNLGIDYGEACKLNVNESIPYSVDQDLSGMNYGLSFCPNGVKF